MEQSLFMFGICLCIELFCLTLVGVDCYPEETIKTAMVHAWAEKLGTELWTSGDFITRRKQVQESYKSAKVVVRDGNVLVGEMAREIKYMMDLKISAVKRIMDAAENTAVSAKDEPVTKEYRYYNSKELYPPGMLPEPEQKDLSEIDEVEEARKLAVPAAREMVLTPDQRFGGTPINTTFSAVHVPTNVFDRDPEVIKAIKWSDNLDSIFTNNYHMDPTLSWQYFGSSTGFMRQYPAMKWIQDPVDLYDCRTRSWYIEAATSPKDVIILVDNSGSMTGQNKDIAKHVVSNILDTLGNNDFVNVFTFSNEVEEVVPCFNDMLVQANLANIRELKLGMENFKTEDIANFSLALTKAFEILEFYRIEHRGADCNQAIMLITDGVPYSYSEIFEQYNWQDLPYMPVRMFTYLIGKEVTDVQDVKWMACANQGYYVHLSTLAEVREQVLQYIPVMARPMVLWKSDHPTIWTPVYADITDPKMTDWEWEAKESEEQKERFLSMRHNRKKFFSQEEQDRRYLLKYRGDQGESDMHKYQLMTSVSMPVYDRRENANITENVLINEAYWVTVTRETRVANLLGVAGTDVPIQDIKRLMMPHVVGVNAYAFIVTNNGYILIHPDLRPVFQGILKPAYNSVDMVEVELVDDNGGPRDFNVSLLAIRDAVINQSSGSRWMQVKYHLDSMRRVSRIRRQYYWTQIKGTPFTLVLTIPEPYGLHRLQVGPLQEIHRMHVNGANTSSYFVERNWRIHPDWLYCKQSDKSFATPEDELMYFLERMDRPGWKWPSRTPYPPPEHHAALYCDRTLMQNLVFDARVTQWFSQDINSVKDPSTFIKIAPLDSPNPIALLMVLLPRKEFIRRFGLTVVFVATHSGLTRWKDFYGDDMNPDVHDFSEKHAKSIDEVWYRRAVEQYIIEKQSFVYSVPFDVGDRNDTLVTASHAIYHSEERQGQKSSAPAAVVGMQFRHSALAQLFRNITINCAKTCQSGDLDCYALDNNGYVVVGSSAEDTGKFFGEVRPHLMLHLIQDRVYRQIEIVDYQAVCFKPTETSNPASKLSATLQLMNILDWTISRLIWILSLLVNVHGYAFSYSNDEAKKMEYDVRVLINRTRPQPCDQQVLLYQLQQFREGERTPYNLPAKGCDRPYVVQMIPYSNLILLVADALCLQRDTVPYLVTIPFPVDYNATLACHKAKHNNELPRKRPTSCISRHHNESSIELCGDGSSMSPSKLILSLLFLNILSMIFST
ncbi:voltage-dependent calcium channel subunit alpha-2/delta-3-like [Ctenocephalides felis]|uniref:voltage-dependent calcium channel subunit alpha-2/delta-3-like n=1 Tax=Ctenocephalides felis TaxID=7515 RepID=UPI000E6E44AE|nr:voltage-dependent calcium channel subunit alpha-2/delta-3-like [Ctenocephalides felis]